MTPSLAKTILSSYPHQSLVDAFIAGELGPFTIIGVSVNNTIKMVHPDSIHLLSREHHDSFILNTNNIESEYYDDTIKAIHNLQTMYGSEKSIYVIN